MDRQRRSEVREYDRPATDHKRDGAKGRGEVISTFQQRMPPEPLTTNNKASQRQHGPETKATFNETIEQGKKEEKKNL
ncbi:hypothetical protein TNCV_2485741 [Trichonephila clavipes]|uniref:Uncharacterized protein n=1 Tax=Trichonephila clavipes TaxID=2585209 RepID=A0A8X6VZV6_TRICX|nr:hypothetical protein TNCV_2485741 [Trichonephila clavipes]